MPFLMKRRECGLKYGLQLRDEEAKAEEWKTASKKYPV